MKFRKPKNIHAIGRKQAATAPPNRRMVPFNQIEYEEGSEDVMATAEMQPYIKLAIALEKKSDPNSELDAIREMPLEQRYLWRVSTGLKQAFADYDSMSAWADMRTLKPDDLNKVIKPLNNRAIQFCLLLKTLVGGDEMRRLMGTAVEEALGRITPAQTGDK